MSDQLQILEQIAARARQVRDLEAMLVKTADTRKAMDRLQAARLELDEALTDLTRLERER